MYKLIAPFLLTLLLLACSGEEAGPTFPDIQTSLPPAGPVTTVTGTCTFKGKAPSPKDIGVCQGNNASVPDQTIRVGDEGGLRDVVVWIKKGLEDYTFPHNKQEATIDQKDCLFVPHVLAVQAHQPIRIKNSDAIIHNVNLGSKKGQSFVTTITPGRGSVVHQIREPEVGMRITCDVHAYMLMYVHVLPHPYFAISAENGSFKSPDLPEGDYILEASHPQLGSQTRKLVIRANAERPPINFVFSAN